MNDIKFNALCMRAFELYQQRVPYTPSNGMYKKLRDTSQRFYRESTGNLRNNATQKKWRGWFGKKQFEIGVQTKIAPYVFYTNEEWKSPKWKGKQNPNEGWFQDAFDAIRSEIEKVRD